MSQENVEIARKAFELFDRRDFAGATELLDRDVVMTRSGDIGHLSGEWRGQSATRNALGEYGSAWADLRHDLERVVDLGDRVLVVAKKIGRGRSSGVSVEVEVAVVVALRGAKIVRFDAYRHASEAIQAVGLEE